MFGKNLLDDETLVPMYQDLLGYGAMKPFDCVGTFEEAQAALYLVRESYKDACVVEALLPRITDSESLVRSVMGTTRAPNIPTLVRFCGMKNALILGYGLEGKATEKYLKQTHPHLSVSVADKSTSDDYLDEQATYDIVVKTPGIPKEKVSAHYVTATNLFFS